MFDALPSPPGTPASSSSGPIVAQTHLWARPAAPELRVPVLPFPAPHAGEVHAHRHCSHGLERIAD